MKTPEFGSSMPLEPGTEKRHRGISDTITFLRRTVGEGIENPAIIFDTLQSEHYGLNDYLRYLKTINGIVRRIPIVQREFNPNHAHVGTSRPLEFAHIAPHPDVRQKLLGEAFDLVRNDKIRQLPTVPKVAARILFNAITMAHPFKDGNGRTARMIYFLMTHPEYSSDEEFGQEAIKVIAGPKKEFSIYFDKLNNHFYEQELAKRGLDTGVNDSKYYHGRLYHGRGHEWGFEPNCLGYLAVYDAMTSEERKACGKKDEGTDTPYFRMELLPSDIRKNYDENMWKTREEFARAVILASADEQKWPTELQQTLDASFYGEGQK
jgi:hypothetical protein